MSHERIVSASGIRGVVGEALNPEVAARYGAAFGAWLSTTLRLSPGEGKVLVARDSRTSGPVLADAVAAGLRATGRVATLADVCPTPSALLSVQDDSDAVGGVVVTASHNPVEWNGLKLVGPEGLFLSPDQGREVQESFERGPAYGAWDAMGGTAGATDVVGHHLERILSLPLVNPDRIVRLGARVALDCVRGAGGTLMPRLLERLGCAVVGRDLEPDGRFPRNPEPRPEHLTGLSELVRREGADLGMAVDPDADRLALVDETGSPVGEEWTLALAVELVLSRGPGPVVVNLSTSRVAEDIAAAHGASVYRSPVGEANVAAEMRERGATVGGEGNGGVMLAELHLTRDAPLAAALVLELLAERDRPLSEILSRWPRYHMVKGRADLPERSLEELYAAVRSALPAGAEADRRDGLRLAWADRDRWIHVRPSGTEPILRIIAEGREEDEAEELVRAVREILQGAPA